MFSSYRDLTRPIPPKHNLLDAVNSAALSLCDTCRIALPNRAQAKNKSISTPYEIFDTFPEFPRLKKSSKEARCGLCRAIRDQLLRTWAARPMEEWGVGPLSERSGIFDELLSAPWDRSVRISKLTWVLEPQPDIARVTHESESDSHPGGGVITNMSVEFGPATTAVNEHGDPLHENISQTMSFKVFDSIDLDAPKPLARRLPSTAALSEENIGVMKDWIRDCQEHHRVCNESLDTADPEWIPTRLLYVGSSAADDLPRIVEKDTLIKASTATTADSDSAVQRRRVQFAALSHMWGDVDMAPPTQALHSNYEQMKRDLPTSRLSQNFRDAVETCRRLGLQYIWIDSLCIIQDSNSDWELEAGSMHMVYQYAVVTIVATAATSAHDGFLSRNISLIPAIKIDYSAPDNSGSRHLILVPLGDFEEGLRSGDVDGSKWNTRGWTMQERSLSTRTLHFCHNKIYFECRQRLSSEENEPEPRTTYSSFLLWPRPARSSAAPPSQTQAEQWYKHWSHAVISYSRRRLTVSSDKLTAVKSLAGAMSAYGMTGYLENAGMWLGNLKRELLWHPVGFSRRPAVRRAPSWSWASLDARVGFAIGSLGDGDGPLRSPKYKFSLLSVRSDLVTMKAMSWPIGRVQESDERAWERASFPYDMMLPSGKVFAHGLLDLDNRDSILNSPGILTYVHVAGDQHPSGVIVHSAPTRGSGAYHVPEVTRIGVATIFQTHGPLLFPDVFDHGEDDVLYISQ